MEKSYDFLFWAYNVVWLAIVGYVVFIALRLRRVGLRLDRLERKLAGNPSQKSNGS